LSGSAAGEGLWLLGVVGDEAIDGGLEIDDAFEDAALGAALGENGEETLGGAWADGSRQNPTHKGVVQRNRTEQLAISMNSLSRFGPLPNTAQQACA